MLPVNRVEGVTAFVACFGGDDTRENVAMPATTASDSDAASAEILPGVEKNVCMVV